MWNERSRHYALDGLRGDGCEGFPRLGGTVRRVRDTHSGLGLRKESPGVNLQLHRALLCPREGTINARIEAVAAAFAREGLPTEHRGHNGDSFRLKIGPSRGPKI